ncbi:MAG TPA: class I SAM-dependent methyltransferase [Candidatus Paceibacterota bacterium]
MMDRGAFDLLDKLERTWWYRGRSESVRSALLRTHSVQTEAVLDFGAGFGGMYDTLARFGTHIDALEPDDEARVAAKARGYRRVFASDAEVFATHYDLIGLFDVVEHIERDGDFLVRMREALKEGGRLAITVPAFPFLWSIHDVSHGHFRRYTKASLRAVVEASGYTVEYMSYWNMSLFFPAAALRLLGRSGESAASLPRWLDNLFFAIVKIESSIMRFVPFPFGTGLVVIARRK